MSSNVIYMWHLLKQLQLYNDKLNKVLWYHLTLMTQINILGISTSEGLAKSFQSHIKWPTNG